MGDNHKLYVVPELVPLMRTVLVPLADIVVPNHFELEYACATTRSRATPVPRRR